MGIDVKLMSATTRTTRTMMKKQLLQTRSRRKIVSWKNATPLPLILLFQVLCLTFQGNTVSCFSFRPILSSPSSSSSPSSLRYSKYISSGSRFMSNMAMAEDNNNQDNDDDDDDSSISKCPFSKTFPRYRIDLTRFKQQQLVPSPTYNKGEKSNWPMPSLSLPSFGSPLKGLSDAMIKSKIEQQKRRSDEPLIWATGVQGVEAFTLLWKRTADLINPTSTTSSEIIGLPDASPQLVQNWVEIMEWMETNPETETLVKASLIYPSSGNSKSSSSSSSDEVTTTTVRIERVESTATLPEFATESKHSETATVKTLIVRTQAWVKRMLVEEGICPFTKSIEKSGQGLADVGVPVGKIAYHGSIATHPITLFADTWQAILDMLQAGPDGKQGGVSSILLAAPNFDDDFEYWAGPIFTMLESGVVASGGQAQVGVVCFHPRYATPDGSSWPGFGHMHSVPRLEKWYQDYWTKKIRGTFQNLYKTKNDADSAEGEDEEKVPTLSTDEIAAGGAWQRRTPHATINVLRADQLEAAESRRMTEKLYAENIEKLVGTSGIGSNQLATDLDQERKI